MALDKVSEKETFRATDLMNNKLVVIFSATVAVWVDGEGLLPSTT
jgi:hypothetical protein